MTKAARETGRAGNQSLAFSLLPSVFLVFSAGFPALMVWYSVALDGCGQGPHFVIDEPGNGRAPIALEISWSCCSSRRRPMPARAWRCFVARAASQPPGRQWRNALPRPGSAPSRRCWRAPRVLRPICSGKAHGISRRQSSNSSFVIRAQKAGTDKKTATGDIRKAQKQLGHSCVQATERYIRSRGSDRIGPTK